MTTLFDKLPVVVQNLLGIWLFLIISMNASNCAYSRKASRKKHMIATFVLWLLSLLLFETECLYMHMFEQKRTVLINIISADAAVIGWYTVYAMVTAASLILAYTNTLYGKQTITVASFKLCADAMPVGVCFYRDSGRIMLLTCVWHVFAGK